MSVLYTVHNVCIITMNGSLLILVIYVAFVNANNGGSYTNLDQTDAEGDEMFSGLISQLRQELEGLRNETNIKLKELEEELAKTQTELGKCVDFKTDFEEYTLNVNASAAINNSVSSRVFKQPLAPYADVAFSAYLDHDIDTLGKGQTIIFNQIITNNGDAYNTYNGMFTTPITGMYVFHISIRIQARPEHATELWVQLKRNAENIIDASADVRALGEDQQASNLVVLHLNKGDVVYVAELLGSKLRGDSFQKGTNFSGFMLSEG